MDELLAQFLVEGRELVQAAGDDLLALESAPADTARLDGAFRAVHTLKGGAGLFDRAPDLSPMSRALAAAEDLLGALRAARASASAAAVDAALGCMAACDGWLDAIAASGALPEGADREGAALAAALRRAAGAGHAVGAPVVPEPVAAWAEALAADHRDAVARAADEGSAVTALLYRPAPDCFFLGDDPLALLRAVPGLIALALSEDGAAPGDPGDPFTCRVVIAALAAGSPEAVRAPFRFVADQVAFATLPPTLPPVPPVPVAPAPASPPRAVPASAPRGLRVEAERVDALLALAGELVAAKAGLPAEGRAEVDRLAVAIHGGVLRLRMVPLSQCFRRLPRIVRDAAARLGRTVELRVEGGEVELDRDAVDGLYEPLLHALRNAVDHGIEPPEARAAANKPATGRVTLRAFRDADAVVVSVEDDGAGMDPTRIRAAAAARGLGDPAALAALDDAAALDLVFAPGFSTAAAVTDISGRGVGMDAVRAAVAALGGRVALSSSPGFGTELRLLLPRASLLATVLTLEAGGERYGVPIEAVREVLRVPGGDVGPAGSGEAFVLRGRAVPLLDLAALLGGGGGRRAGGDARVIVADVGGAPVGLAVDAVGARLDLVLRAPAGLLAAVPGLMGTALTPDGGTLLVLDLPGLVG